METRNTKQKEKIIEYLKKNSNMHLSIQKIQEDLGTQIGLTTIYRMVNSLIKEGKMIKIPLDNKQGFCYQYIEKTKECNRHYHLICEKCGQLFHYETDKIFVIEKDANKKFGFNIDDEKVVFYGICNNCKGK